MFAYKSYLTLVSFIVHYVSLVPLGWAYVSSLGGIRSLFWGVPFIGALVGTYVLTPSAPDFQINLRRYQIWRRSYVLVRDN